MEQKKLSKKTLKQTFHITDIKHNVAGIPFFSKLIPIIVILNSKIQTKEICIQDLKTDHLHSFEDKINNHHFSPNFFPNFTLYITKDENT